MKQIGILWWAALICLLLGGGALAEAMPIEADAQIAVYSINGEEKQRMCGDWADLSALGEDEYYSFYFEYKYVGSAPLAVNSFYVVVDNGEAWMWKPSDKAPGESGRCHVFYSNMPSCMTPGLHSVTWYLNDQPIHSETFLFTNGPTAADPVPEMNWDAVFDMPTDGQIRARAGVDDRSPYIGGWMDAAQYGRFDRYAVDFRAATLPGYTYCCPGQWYIDTRGLKGAEDGHCYAGLQLAEEGLVSILSFWDVLYGDQVIRAERVYPEMGAAEDDFSGEGTGAHTLVHYDWAAGNWYRMLMACMKSDVTGNTQVEQWICDLQTGEWTRLCAYDLGYPDACFKGNIALFLENFNVRTAGDVRTMEVRNPRIRIEKTGSWQAIESVRLCASGGLSVGYSGSYAYGASGDGIYLISSGVGGWTRDGETGAETGSGQPEQTFSMSGASSAPY